MYFVNSKALLLGASGMVGEAVRLRAAQMRLQLTCLSRAPPTHAEKPHLCWTNGNLFCDRIDFSGDCVISAGPLDGLVAWLQRESPSSLRRVVALSSTSMHVKQNSSASAERELAIRLCEAEAMLVAWCASRSATWTLLRPTLVYNDQFDGALGRIVALARRLGAVALPSDARGLRQPVHADDVAQALLAALGRPESANLAYDLPGGETMEYCSMITRLLANAAPRARVLSLSPSLFALAGPIARRFPALVGLTPEVLGRMREDLVFDSISAQRDLDYQPRGFITEKNNR